MAKRKNKLRRTDLPVSLPGATEFHGQGLTNELWAVRIAKQLPQFFEGLLRETNRCKPNGRKRIPGNIAYAYLAYVASRSTEMYPWWEMSHEALWQECGFLRKPPYTTVYDAFCALEGRSDAFNAAAALMIQHAVKASGGLVGRDVHIDSTEAQTNARLEHDCQPGEPCKRDQNRHLRGGRKGDRRITAELTTEEAREHRQKLAEEPAPEDKDAVNIGEANKVEWDPKRGVMRIQIGKDNCWYRLLDPEAGPRAYKRNGKAKKFWVGYYNMKAVDHYTGAPLAVHVCSASLMEYNVYPEVYEAFTSNTGQTPRAVVADKGFSVSKVFQFNSERGVASVMPFRPGGMEQGQHRRKNRLRYDEDGVPRCKGCHGPTRFVRFSHRNPKPRIWFSCMAPQGKDCEGQQSIYCEHDWRYLLPLWRTSEAYWALMDSHNSYERAHVHWRQRYSVAGNNFVSRPKRRGRGCQQLRSNAALVLEWLKVLHREGWLGSARRNDNKPVTSSGAESLARRIGRRFENRLHLPYTREMKIQLGWKPPLTRGSGPPGADPPDPQPA